MHQPLAVSSGTHFSLRCRDACPLECDAVFHATTLDGVVARMRDHGARAHGFTPSWYSPYRLAAMAAAATGADRAVVHAYSSTPG